MRIAAVLLWIASSLLSTYVVAAPCDGFVDVDFDASYCGAVYFIKSRGVTVGCTDATHYCPADYVTRAQMALYLQRSAQADPTNVLNSPVDALVGGQQNTSGAVGSQNYAFVGGGFLNFATGFESVVGGGFANHAIGEGSAIPGGEENTASGYASFAAGNNANADKNECAVFSLWFGNTMSCLGVANIFRVGANHGFAVDYYTPNSDGSGTRWVEIGDNISGQTIGTWTGAFLSDGGTWTNASDRAAKENFKDIDPADVLNRVTAMPITRWQYKRDPAVTHLGPVAQDFRAAFGLGLNDTSISTVDEEGVALAAIQGLNAKLEARNEVLAHEISQLRAQMTTVLQLLADHQK